MGTLKYDLTGQRIHMLTVIKRVENSPDGYVQFLCQCDCGNQKIIKSDNLRSGRTHSCGCYGRKRSAESHYKHGASGHHSGKDQHRLYRIWHSMISRCYIPSATEYKNYGGRGIAVSDEWREDYIPFRDWAMANGYDDSLTIDRIDNDGNYSPSNCRWISKKKQMNNKSNNHILEFNGKSQTITEWAEEIGFSRSVLSQRINRYHWPVEKALTTPVKKVKHEE